MEQNGNHSLRLKVGAIIAGQSGCAFWRMRMPIRKIEENNYPVDFVKLVSDKLLREDCYKLYEECYVVAFQAPGSSDASMLMKQYQDNGIPVTIDYDDMSFDLSPANPRYRDLGLKEVEGQWKHQHNGFYLNGNQEKYQGFIEAVKMSDTVTVTTPYLKQRFLKEGAKEVHILPNSIDFDLWRPIPRPESLHKEIRIGWFGGDSHLIDLKEIAPQVINVINKYPNVKFVMQGPHPMMQFFKDIPKDRVELRDWADVDFHPYSLGCRFFDIGLAPLEYTEFNNCKSNIKFLEYAALKVPCIATDVEPYKEIENGVTGFRCKNDEFEKYLSLLIENEELRKNIGEQAYAFTRVNYNIAVNCKLWYEHYKYLTISRSKKWQSVLTMQSSKSEIKQDSIPSMSQPIKTG